MPRAGCQAIRIRKNDIVKVIAGRDKGKTGRVLEVDRDNGPGAGRRRA